MNIDNCQADCYDESTGMCTADGDMCAGFNCPFEQYVSEETPDPNKKGDE